MQIVANENLNDVNRKKLIFDLTNYAKNGASDQDLRIFKDIHDSKFPDSYIIKPKLKKTLRDFVATSNTGKYKTEYELLSKFPELKIYKIEILRDFVATSNYSLHKTENEILSKFPEFFSKEKKAKYGKITVLNQQMIANKIKLGNNIRIINNIWILAVILFVFLYPIRLIFFLLKWSYKILK